ncbi:MAG: enoyl-CoA hydratase/isomerase family protein, partial [Hyphomicrobium sp.]|nr:enoyl-CoA hydratase/isomerase family protein [Hyphomicrobium sp.]
MPTEATPPTLRTLIEGGICTIVADNPARLNAYTRDMWEALPRLIREAEADPAVRVIVLRGAGTKAFSAGADISEFEGNRTGAEARRYDEINHEAFEAVGRATKPTIAMVHGYCFGGGCELAICCDMRWVAEDAIFSIPAAKLSIGYNPRWIRPMLAVMSA